MKPKERQSPAGKFAKKKTREKFADKISSLTSFTATEVEELFPKKTDQEELKELIKIVDEATDDNTKKAKLITNIRKISGAVLKVAKKVVV